MILEKTCQRNDGKKNGIFAERYFSVIQSCSEELPYSDKKVRMARLWGQQCSDRHDPIPFESEVKFALTGEVGLFSSRPKDDLCSQYLTV